MTAPIVAWAFVAVFLGLILGMAAVMLPPTGAFGIVAVAALALMWVTPDLPAVPDRLVRRLFFIVLVVDLCVPAYYTVQVSELPWISARRVVTFPLILLFAIVVSGSSTERARMARALGSAKAIAICAFGFLGMIFLSVFTSISPAGSLSQMTDAILVWYVPLWATILVIRTEDDLFAVLRVIGWCAIFIAGAAMLEFILQRQIFIELLPRGLVSALAEQNPAFAAMAAPHAGSGLRNGLYRVSSVFEVPLSLGEFEAIIAPIGYFFAVHGRSAREKTFGWTIALTGLAAIFCSGARGGYLSWAVATAAFVLIWTIRKLRFDRNSLAPALVALCTIIGFAILVALTITWPRLHNVILGGGDAAGSDEGRKIQFALAMPKIMANPLTGHGFAQAGDVIGYYSSAANPIPSVDSYVLTVLVDTGVPGFLFFFGMVIIGIWFGVRQYLTAQSRASALSGCLACSLAAFGFYRIFLSAVESHVLFFVLVGCIVWLSHFATRPVSAGAEARVAKPRRIVSGRPERFAPGVASGSSL